MLWVPLNMGMSAAHCQGISECLESGHTVTNLGMIVCSSYAVIMNVVIFLLQMDSEKSFQMKLWTWRWTRMMWNLHISTLSKDRNVCWSSSRERLCLILALKDSFWEWSMFCSCTFFIAVVIKLYAVYRITYTFRILIWLCVHFIKILLSNEDVYCPVNALINLLEH